MPPLRIDGNRRFDHIKLLDGEECTDGPFWLTQSAGDLQMSNAIFVTNGTDAWPIGAVVGLYGNPTPQ